MKQDRSKVIMFIESNAHADLLLWVLLVSCNTLISPMGAWWFFSILFYHNWPFTDRTAGYPLLFLPCVLPNKMLSPVQLNHSFQKCHLQGKQQIFFFSGGKRNWHLPDFHWASVSWNSLQNCPSAIFIQSKNIFYMDDMQLCGTHTSNWLPQPTSLTEVSSKELLVPFPDWKFPIWIGSFTHIVHRQDIFIHILHCHGALNIKTKLRTEK